MKIHRTAATGTYLAALSLAALTLTGCGDQADKTPDVSATNSEAPTAIFPASLFASAAPADFLPLLAAKTDAKPDTRVVFEARIGGSRDPFVENRAVFFVADPSLADCDTIEEDHCKTPWDYCCEPQDNKRKHMATVQVVDAGGQPLKLSLQGEHGLTPGVTVYISGTVEQVDDAGNFVVNADSIYVKES